jgi:predicted transposase YdaD
MGIAEGLEQGLIQGRREGERSLILRLLTRRIGVVPADLTLRIEQLSIEQLEALAEALLDFSRVEELVNWLAILVLGGVANDRS